MNIHKKVINLEKNCVRLLDASDLFDAVCEECKKLHDDGVREKMIGQNGELYRQPYIIDDVIVDIYSGQVVIYYHDNEPS